MVEEKEITFIKFEDLKKFKHQILKQHDEFIESLLIKPEEFLNKRGEGDGV